jgi:hypothetical protein
MDFLRTSNVGLIMSYNRYNLDIMNVSESLESSVNEFTKFYGVSDVANMYKAAISVASSVKAVCLPLVLIAITFVFLGQMTRWVVGERELNIMKIGKCLLLLICLTNYEEILGQLNGIIGYFSDAVGPTLGNYNSGTSLTQKVDILLDFNQSKENFNIFTDGLSNILDWLVANCSHLIIIISRAVIYCIRELYMMFLMAVGPIAVLLSMFPLFEKTVLYWLNAYLSSGFWALTMGVLDRILNAYLDRMIATHDGSGLIVMNIGIALMYLLVPYMTSKYIGGTQSQLMGGMVRVTRSILPFAMGISGGTQTAFSSFGFSKLQKPTMPNLPEKGDHPYSRSMSTHSENPTGIFHKSKSMQIPKQTNSN